MSTTTAATITKASLMSLEQYAKARPEYRKAAIAHKRLRKVHVGNHVTLMFEDEQTLRYQIQEILRAEKTFEEQGILDELEAYLPLLPTGKNLKATMLIEYTDEAERKVALTKLKGIERKTWVQVEGSAKVYAIADEDLERETETKTSAVHFLRFEFAKEMIEAVKYGVTISVGVDHTNYTAMVSPLSPETRDALARDFG